jgi:hypothetical protein
MIRLVDRGQFDIRDFDQPPQLHQELSWFATDDNCVLGVVTLDHVDHDFGWVVLTQNEQGPGFTAIDLGISLPTGAAATQALHEAMLAHQHG